MGQADADLGEPLPQVPFFARTSLPAGLKDLMRREGPPLLHQPSGQVQGLRRRQWLLRNLLDTGSPIGQRAAESITRSLLTWAASNVPIPVASHQRHQQD
jgi:hypothetical protein